MSRLALIASLVFGISSASLVSTADAQFAKAPPATSVSNASAADVWEPAYRVAPKKELSRAAVRAALVKARATNLAAFRAYQAKGIFPSNTFQPGKLNVWVDANGNYCAAATIIQMSGLTDLVTKTGEQNNFIKLADVKQGPLMDWILMSGFTQDEIAAIQEPFDDVTRGRAEPAPAPITASVDAKKRKAEDARLIAKYKQVDRALVKNANKSLDAAVDHLMKHQDLAWKLIAPRTSAQS
jgi:hypothetical protein